MSYTANYTKVVNRNLKKKGVLDAFAAKKEHYNKVAQSLGFKNDKVAFKAMGKEFTKIAKISSPSINNAILIKKQISDALDLISKGWEVELAVDCTHDVVFDLISKEAFVKMCMNTIK